MRTIGLLRMWLFKRHAVGVETKRVVSGRSKLRVWLVEFPAFSVCPSSKLQLLQRDPTQ